MVGAMELARRFQTCIDKVHESFARREKVLAINAELKQFRRDDSLKMLAQFN